MWPSAQKSNFTTKCLNTFVANCSSSLLSRIRMWSMSVYVKFSNSDVFGFVVDFEDSHHTEHKFGEDKRNLPFIGFRTAGYDNITWWLSIFSTPVCFTVHWYCKNKFDFHHSYEYNGSRHRLRLDFRVACRYTAFCRYYCEKRVSTKIIQSSAFLQTFSGQESFNSKSRVNL